MCPAPVDTPIAGPGGNINSSVFTDYGCPVYSSGETYLSELMFVNAKKEILDWVQQVALAGDAYCNPKVLVEYADKQHFDAGPGNWTEGWGDDVRVQVLNVDRNAAGVDSGEDDDE